MIDEELDKMSIFALREFARRVGVVSPTSKKKEQLITEIVEIREGKRQPSINTTKHGRPPKTNNYAFEPQPSYQPYNNGSGIIVLNQKPSVFQFEDDITTICGYVEILPNNTGLLWCYKNFAYNWIYIPSEIVFTSHIITGDLATAEIGIVDNQQCVKKIFNINGCPMLKFDPKRHNYFDYKHILPTKKLPMLTQKFDSLNLLKGECVYFYGNNNNVNTQKIVELLNGVDGRKLYLNLSIAEKNKGFVEKLERAELFIANVTDSAEQAQRMITLCTERAKRIFETGENAVVVIDDVASLFDVDADKTLTKTLMSLTKNSNAAGSITIWAIMKNVSAFDKLYDKKFNITSENFERL